MIITDVQTQHRRETRRSIFVDGEFALGVSEEIYVKYSLFKGREVTPEFIQEVRHAEELYSARGTAMRYLSYRMRSVQEVEKKLRSKDYSEEAIAATMQFLESYNMTDDNEFARAFINDRLLKRRIGRRKLEMELRQKGVDREDAAEAVKGIISEDDELENALAAGRKKASRLKTDDRIKWERSLASFLAGRGFGWDAVRKVIDTLKGEYFPE